MIASFTVVAEITESATIAGHVVGGALDLEPLDVRVLEEAREDEEEEQREDRSEEDGRPVSPEDLLVEAELVQDQRRRRSLDRLPRSVGLPVSSR